MESTLPRWKKWFQDHREAVLANFFEFLRFESIATDPAYDGKTKACASWLKDHLEKIGMDAELWETSGQPVVFASHCKAGPDRPTLLIYHHYDVQPVDPLELWDSPPFEPVVKEGEVYARGAQDNKGQCFYSVSAIEAFLSMVDSLSFNLKLFIEGEEESGSEGTREVFEKKKEALKSDMMLIVDSGIPAPNVAAITLGIRGITTMEIECKVADTDMHSGSLGGIAYNPIRALASALSKLWSEDGKVMLPHFYDDVVELSDEEKKSLYLEVDEERLRKDIGLKCFSKEPGYTLGESGSIRPTVEINGMWGGYTGEGFKTVLPAAAFAKLSCRLVEGQDPEKIQRDIVSFLEKHLPEGMELKVKGDHGSKAYSSSSDTKIAKLAANAYEEVMGSPCKQVMMGGSIAIVVDLAEACGSEVVMMGYGLDTDQIHAPNEHFGLDRFEQGFLTIGMILSSLNEP